jgi:hypothetical protein
MARAEFEAALAAGRALMPSSASAPPASAQTPCSDPQLLDAEQLEAVTGVPATWWMAAARSRRIPFRRIGRRVRFVLDEIIACERFKCAEIDRLLPGTRFVSKSAKTASA